LPGGESTEKEMRIRIKPELAEALEKALTEYFIMLLDKVPGLPGNYRDLWQFLARLRGGNSGRPQDAVSFPFWNTEEGQRKALAWLKRERYW